MSAFLFVQPVDDRPLDLSAEAKNQALAALQERAGGHVTCEESTTFFAAAVGWDGAMERTGERLWIRDGQPLRDGNPVGFSGLPHSQDPTEWHGVTGSYAVCSYHIPSRSLTLVRDHFGKKPVFYGEANGLVAVASECKILQALGFELEVDPAPLKEALVYRWVIGEWHIFRSCRQVEFGSVVSWTPGESFRSRRYWEPVFRPEPDRPDAVAEFCDLTDQALRKTIRAAHKAYGRVGLLLSGGVDSSLLAGLAKDELGSLEAFVGRIPGCEKREDERAMKVAEMLDIPCHVVDIDPSRFQEDMAYMVRRIEELPRHPNNLVVNQLYEAASGTVDVMLEGDATGTLWGHMNGHRTLLFEKKTQRARAIPRPLRRAMARILEQVPTDRAWRIARVLAWEPHMYARTQEALYYSQTVRETLGLSLLNEENWKSGEWDETASVDDESQTYMIRNLIRGGCIRHDRLSQPHGIVALSPFMSNDCWDACCRMPRGARVRDGKTKPVLRDLLDRYLPREVGQWSKVGFEVPWPSWLQNELRPLRDEAEDFLRNDTLLPRGYWETSNRVEDPEGIWTCLSFYLLHREFGLLGTSG